MTSLFPQDLFKRTWKRLNSTGDTEAEQAVKLRLTMGILLVIYFCYPWKNDIPLSEHIVTLPSLIALNYYVIAILIVLAILRNPKPSPIRRVCGSALDMLSLSAVMLIAGEYSVPLFMLYLWVILGNGFRYGTRYLYIAQVISLSGFVPALVWGDYWNQHTAIGISLLVMLIAIPMYSAFLLKKLHEAVSDAKQANEAKSRFLANMSHELRTPLNGVIGMGELLRETKLSFEQHELINSIHNSANTLLELIENVLDISKIEAGKVVIDSQPFDLHALVNSVRYMLAPMGEGKGLSVSCNIDPETPFALIGDQPHLRQVLINLISNAIKFTDEGSVNLNVFMSEGNKDKPIIRFEVIDTGIGIEESAQKQIFENFTQADANTNRKYGGTGLGTTISKDLVGLMGGEIGLKSELGKGSTFWFELPFSVMPQSDNTLTSERLLLLANEETASVVRPSLEDWEIDFDWVQSPARAFSILVNAAEENRGYEVIIVDQACMIEINPVQFAQMVRAEKDLDIMSMILINSSDTMIQNNLVDQYYITTLQSPEDKRLLFNSIHAAQSSHLSDSNVVTLAEHYARQGSAKVLDILVAEDNPVNQQVIEGILKHAGHRVRLAETGEKALDMLSHHLDKIDLLILDMNMPKISGVEVVKALRFMDTSKSIPVIMLTADATLEAKEESLNAGADSFLTKPVDARFLLEKVAVLTKNKKGKRSQSLSNRTLPVSKEQVEINKSVWFDENKLGELLKLGDGLSFVEGLIDGYIKSGKKYIENLIKYAEDDYPSYRENLHTLKGSSTELGAKKMIKICLECEKLKPYDMGTEKIKRLNREVEKTFDHTVSALKEAITHHSIHNPTSKD